MIGKALQRISLQRNLLITKSGASITTIATDKAPKAIGAYSQGKIVSGGANLIFTSGSIGINPAVEMDLCFQMFLKIIFSFRPAT
jgi:enamine deaminase RidA (YjgF/YER057c/UK114 family)